MTSKYGIKLKGNQNPTLMGYINNILCPNASDPMVKRVASSRDTTYDEDGRRGKRQKYQRAEKESLLIPYYQKDGSCAVKTVEQYVEENTYKEV